MRKKLLVLMAVAVLLTACTENKSEGEAANLKDVNYYLH